MKLLTAAHVSAQLGLQKEEEKTPNNTERTLKHSGSSCTTTTTTTSSSSSLTARKQINTRTHAARHWSPQW